MATSGAPTLSQTSYVHSLDGLKPLEDFIRDNGSTLVAIFHPLAPRWQRFSPVLEKIAGDLSTTGSDVQCVQINSVGNIDLVAKFAVKKYPTIVLCQASGEFKTYHGALRQDDVVAFLRRQDMPAVTTDVNETSLQEIKDAHKTVIVACLSSDHEPAREWVTAIAKDLRDNFVFCTSDDPHLAAVDGVPVPSVVVYKRVAEEKSVLRHLSSEEAIRGFIHQAVRPLVMEFLPELHEDMLEQTIPLGYIFITSSAEQNQATKDFLPVARRYQGRILFGTVDVSNFPDLAEQMHVNVPPDGWALAIHDPKPNRKYPLSIIIDHSISRHTHTTNPGKVVSVFVQDFLDGNLEPTIKSAPIPDVPSGPIVEVVGLSYGDVVLDPDKDVLVEFYTPWCGPCKVLLPAYERLAALYALDERMRDLVTIAKIDYDANDVPDKDIRGFPWFKLYPAGEKGEPVTYSGDWTVEGWMKFIAENGTHGGVLGLGMKI